MRQYLDHARFILSDADAGYKPNRTGVDTISRFGYQTEYDLSKGFPLMTTKRVPFKAVVHELLWFMRGETNIQPLVREGVHIWDRNAFQYYLQEQGIDKKVEPYSPAWHRGLSEFVERIKTDDTFAQKHGNLGEVYGALWRHWKTRDGKEIDQLARDMKNEVKKILDICYKDAIKLVKDNRKMLDKVSKELLEKETLDRDEFEKIVGNKENKVK